MQTLNLIGAGRLGRSIARLWQARFPVGGLLNNSVASAAAAREFIGAGRVCDRLDAMPPAPFWLLAVPDARIAGVSAALAASGRLRPGDVVFHASGASEAAILSVPDGVWRASVHPAFSFGDPQRAVDTFAGTRCAMEGDAPALARLEPLWRAIGAEPFRLAPGGKPAYHAALTVASNYLVTLDAFALDLAGQAGIDPVLATSLIGALMRQTLDNAVALGPRAALTGPIARGDAATVTGHLAQMDARQAALYAALGTATLDLAVLGPDVRARVLAALTLQETRT